MKVSVVSVNEWLYPDVFDYKTQSDSIDIHAPVGGYAAAQIFIRGNKPGDAIRVSVSDGLLQPECYQLLDALVPYNTGTKLNDVQTGYIVDASDYTTRQAPFRVYDILQPFSEGGNIAEKEVTALYLSVKITGDIPAGIHQGRITVEIGGESVFIPLRVTVHRAKLPEKNRNHTTIWTNDGNMASRYGVAFGSDAWLAMMRKLMKLMRRTRQTHFLIGMGYVQVQQLGNGKYAFDFSGFSRIARMAREEGFQEIELGHLTFKDYVENKEYYIFYSPGRRIPADSDEGYSFLAQFLPKWAEYLKSEGIYDACVQYIGDEPGGEGLAANYRAVCGIVRKFMPGMRFRDALHSPKLRGAVDYFVPHSDYYQLHPEQYDHYRELGDKIWHYTSMWPQGKWLNRFMDTDLLRPRLLMWGNYRFDFDGYLHWAFNHWQPDQPDVREQTHSVINAGTTLLPSGDTHLCYPGNKRGPWMSLRAELTRLGCEDCELLFMISDRDKSLADELCRMSMRGFDDYEEDATVFEKNYIRLLEAADSIL